MEYLLIGLLILAILVSYSREYMTNKDVSSMMQHYGDRDKKKSKDDKPSSAPIFGPTAPKPVDPPSGGKGGGGKPAAGGDYPNIYGPDVPMVPGMKPKKPKHESDNLDDDTYDYNPDLQKAFPTSGPPQPFLTDFSKFQR
jgi:hypothetical protein